MFGRFVAASAVNAAFAEKQDADVTFRTQIAWFSPRYCGPLTTQSQNVSVLVLTGYRGIHPTRIQRKMLWYIPLAAPSIKTTGRLRAPYNTARKVNRHQQLQQKTASLLRVNPAFNFCTRGKQKTAIGCGVLAGWLEKYATLTHAVPSSYRF